MSHPSKLCGHRALPIGLIAVALIAAVEVDPAGAYVPDQRWTVTASGPTGAQGTPITLTWSLVPDGTSIPGEGESNLIDFFDDLFHVSSTSGSLSQRPWFHLIEESFQRWSDLGGINFVYEPNDNGTTLQNSPGALGVRGDVRIGGAFVDGASGTLAYTWLPNSGDMVIDTGESSFYSNPANNYRQLRNTIMHELGHAFGLLHIESSTDALLMEPFINTSFDGPQLDDIRGLHGFYGDALEKSHSGLGNDTPARATSLGTLAAGNRATVGSDAAGGQTVNPSETDFVSIDSNTDVDFFTFTITAPVSLAVQLTPLGGVFSQGVEGGPQSSFNASARNDLSLAMFAADGTTLLAAANAVGAGGTELISGLQLTSAGTYFARITGASENVQLYELELSAVPLTLTLPGDYNQDGIVDAGDFVIWRNTRGQSGTGLAADGDGNGVVNALDYDLWKRNYGASRNGAATSFPDSTAVPEPDWLVSFLMPAAAIVVCGRWLRLRVGRRPVRSAGCRP